MSVASKTRTQHVSVRSQEEERQRYFEFVVPVCRMRLILICGHTQMFLKMLELSSCLAGMMFENSTRRLRS
jgi:hypothetical protein